MPAARGSIGRHYSRSNGADSLALLDAFVDALLRANRKLFVIS